jgi:8-oxo-dGTP diphosphatase
LVNIFALAFLVSGDNVLLLHRKDVSFGSGLYGLSGGKVEQGETARQAVVREVREELGLKIAQSAFKLVHTFHRKGTETEFIALVFKANIADMQLTNNESEKHDEIRFFNLHQLPENIIPAHRQAIECIAKGINYSEHGW